MDVFIEDGIIHTKEHRKETSSLSYLPVQSAHAKHTFSGIVKSQMWRLRRICSKQLDFEAALLELEKRCLRSGYDARMVQDIINDGRNCERVLVRSAEAEVPEKKEIIKLVVLAGTCYGTLFTQFAD